MKKRKRKFTIAVLLAAAAFMLCSCGNETLVSQNRQEELPVIIVGCDDYSPFSYQDVDGNLTGIDVELAREAFHRIGYEPEFQLINWENKKELLKDGTIDCIWSSFTMDGREDEYKWAGPYMRSHQVVAVNEDSDIYTLQDLEDKVIAVQSTTKPEDIIRSHDGTFPDLRKVISVQKRDLIFILLGKGYVDALAAHDTSIDQFMKDTGLKFRILEEPLMTVGLGAAFDKDDTRGLDMQVQEALSSMQMDGTTEAIVGKYLSNADYYLEGINGQN